MTELAKSFEPAAIEAHWAPLWERSGTYRPSLDAGKPSFSIQLPPPNVTGTLHMGHAFNQTIMDALSRWHRMLGHNTLWVPGTDHAGIATQIVVERQLEQQQISRHELGRENFVAKVWQWKQQSGATITQQMRRLGASVDWSHEYFTMDDKLSAVVTDTFVQLYEQGLIYRGKRLVSWDPVLKSAVSDLEVESEEEDGFLWHIRYPLADGSGAGRRRDDAAGDDARRRRGDGPSRRRALRRAGRPDGRRCRWSAGRSRSSPTPMSTANSAPAWSRSRRRTTRTTMRSASATACRSSACSTLDATINDNAPPAYQGLDRFVARKRIVADLDAQGLLVETKKHLLMVPRCARTGQIVEPMLTDQWFVAVSKPGPDGQQHRAQGDRRGRVAAK